MFWLYSLMVALPAIAIYKAVTRLDDSGSAASAGFMIASLVFIIQATMLWAGGWLWMTLSVLVFLSSVLLIAATFMQKDGLTEPLPIAKDCTPESPFTEIEFDYVDANGDRSHRTVEVWAVDEEYFEGHCHKAYDTRTFVIGRIRGKVTVHDTGEVLPPRQWAALARQDPLNHGHVHGRPDAA